MKAKQTCGETKNTPSDQKASNNSGPKSVGNHKHPEAQDKPHPVAGKCMVGAKIK